MKVALERFQHNCAKRFFETGEHRLDRVTPEVRSKIMSCVGSKNTCAEIGVRRLVHAMGYRYVLHRSDLSGRPDLVFPSRGKVIFVHGCFWHGHHCKYGRLPKSRQDYWKSKIDSNKSRDRKQRQELKRQGWRVMVVWQCQLKKQDWLRQRINNFLRFDE
jgi:DNA mismatch endonuclease, patch repair protein